MPRAKSRTSTKSDALPPSRQRLSMTAENYLLSMYRLKEEGTTITLTSLAEHLKMLPEGEGLGNLAAHSGRHGPAARTRGNAIPRLQEAASSHKKRFP